MSHCLLVIFHKWATPKTQKSEEKNFVISRKIITLSFWKAWTLSLLWDIPNSNPVSALIIAESLQNVIRNTLTNDLKTPPKSQKREEEALLSEKCHPCLIVSIEQPPKYNPITHISYPISHNKHSKIWIKSTMVSLKRGKRMLWVRSGTLASLSQLSNSTHEWATNEQIQTPI